MASILIKNGRIFDGENFRYADIFAKDGIIEKIDTDIIESAGYVYDAVGKTVLPGLIDVHTHLRGLTRPGFTVYPDSSCFPFGVTAAADAGASQGDASVIDTFGIKCVAIALSSVKEPINFDMLKKRIEAYGDKTAGVKVFYDKNETPFITDVTPLEKICEYAHGINLPVTVHTSNCPVPMSDLLAVLKAGDIATHIYHGGGHTVAEDYFASALDAKKRGVLLDAGLASRYHVDFEIFKNAIAAGAEPDLISTDMTNTQLFTKGGRYGLTMCMSIARHLGMNEADIFRTVTSSAGKALNREWGHLYEGGCADIAVLEYGYEPFDLTDQSGHRVNSELGYKCLLTVADGLVVYRH